MPPGGGGDDPLRPFSKPVLGSDDVEEQGEVEIDGKNSKKCKNNGTAEVAEGAEVVAAVDGDTLEAAAALAHGIASNRGRALDPQALFAADPGFRRQVADRLAGRMVNAALAHRVHKRDLQQDEILQLQRRVQELQTQVAQSHEEAVLVVQMVNGLITGNQEQVQLAISRLQQINPNYADLL